MLLLVYHFDSLGNDKTEWKKEETWAENGMKQIGGGGQEERQQNKSDAGQENNHQEYAREEFHASREQRGATMIIGLLVL